ncbi:MAG: hypothetical protein M3Q08_01050 [Pseudomonadota bacterium]|nr:hypothetical protein [Pseudomonadota bacterium]
MSGASGGRPGEQGREALGMTSEAGALRSAPASGDGDVITAPMMETLRSTFVVKKPEAEIAPPTIGEFGGMSLGAHHIPGIGPVMSIALHHVDGTTLVATFGYEGYEEFCNGMNHWAERVTGGEFREPEAVQ